MPASAVQLAWEPSRGVKDSRPLVQRARPAVDNDTLERNCWGETYGSQPELLIVASRDRTDQGPERKLRLLRCVPLTLERRFGGRDQAFSESVPDFR